MEALAASTAVTDALREWRETSSVARFHFTEDCVCMWSVNASTPWDTCVALSTSDQKQLSLVSKLHPQVLHLQHGKMERAFSCEYDVIGTWDTSPGAASNKLDTSKLAQTTHHFFLKLLSHEYRKWRSKCWSGVTLRLVWNWTAFCHLKFGLENWSPRAPILGLYQTIQSTATHSAQL